MTQGLWSVTELLDHDPCAPTAEQVTPVEAVAELSPTDRVRRVEHLSEQALATVDEAVRDHAGGKQIVARCILWSGGKDSNVLAHLTRDVATHAVMANTGIGIEQTRQFVRDQAAAWGMPLIEQHPPKSYEQLCLETPKDYPQGRGFPGPAMHWLFYTRLKERCFEAARRGLVTNGRTQRVLYMAGRRRQESERRADVPRIDWRPKQSILWVSPIVNWTALDLTTYRRIHPDVPVNEVSQLLHMSGECLCGANAHPGELEEIREWFPKVAADIDAMADRLRAAGVPAERCVWGRGGKGAGKGGRLCGGCAVRQSEHLFGPDVAA
jgi:3'-phosphoadenosine 5'-phosphosulfate sulfotransferase (PAPS reductase)/FAD synthetase